jgi:hypothetical protein
MTAQNHPCYACGGTGTLPHYSHISDGVCFACQGSGRIQDLKAFNGPNSEVCLRVATLDGAFWYASLACETWKDEADANGTIWHVHCRDRWSRAISDADEARQIWRHAKQMGIRTELDDH